MSKWYFSSEIYIKRSVKLILCINCIGYVFLISEQPKLTYIQHCLHEDKLNSLLRLNWELQHTHASITRVDHTGWSLLPVWAIRLLHNNTPLSFAPIHKHYSSVRYHTWRKRDPELHHPSQYLFVERKHLVLRWNLDVNRLPFPTELDNCDPDGLFWPKFNCV